MDLSGVFNAVNTLINKEYSGNAFTPESFTIFANMAQLFVYSNAVDTADKDGILYYIAKKNDLTTPYALPVDFFLLNAVKCDLRDADVVTPEIFSSKVNNPFYETSRSIAKIEEGKIVLSNSPTAVQLTYYRTPVDCYFDYGIDINGRIQYMEPGSKLIYAGGVSSYDLKNSSNVLIASNITPIVPITADYTSKSKELDIPKSFYDKFIGKMYEMAVVSLKAGLQQ